MARGDAARNWAEQAHGGFDRGLNDVRHSLVEEAWFGRPVTSDMSSMKQGAYEADASQSVSIENTPQIDNGVTIADATFGPQASQADIFGTPAAGMASADASVTPEIDVPETEQDIEPEL